MKYPVMPLWVGDLIMDTQELTSTEFGVYIRLLLGQWKQGSIPDDPGRMENIAPGVTIVWGSIKHHFVKDPDQPGRLINERCHAIKLDVIEKSQKAKKAADARWNK